MDATYIPVSIESIEAAIFPDVALYLKTGQNYVLYKSHGRDFSREDAERLSSNKVDFLFVSPEDMEVITEHMEKSAERFLKSDKFDGKTKGKIIYQTSINFMGDIFTNPHKAGDLEEASGWSKICFSTFPRIRPPSPRWNRSCRIISPPLSIASM